ncbi:Flp pilus assembly protein TadB [Brevibacillus aydinogluensis]|jgi:Flp pilus assembly protein TadB|uniref:type II secretion system F family protein n=1 Tax=Brevibacillus aydinogluensis TaxID=927786 RepID=UPI002892BFCC|nr:hypothetical protein [Brevibacillus aydinogluensis]MDT3417165.1 Flp pilus assembly protein TadB [Brevibacillus aydinogluensis]
MVLGIVLAIGVGVLAFLLFYLTDSGKRHSIKWIQVEKPKAKTSIKFLEEAKQQGVNIGIDQYMTWWGIAIAVSIAMALIFKNPFMVAVVLGAFYFILKIYVYQQELKIREKVKEQLGSAFLNLSSAYRIQKNWMLAMETVMPMLQEPLKSEFTRVYQAHKSGQAIGEAFQDMMERLKIPEMKLFVTMAHISSQIGDEAAEGVFVAGSYFQTKRLAKAELDNAMLSAVKETRWMTLGFVGTVIYFRLFQEEIFRVFMDSLLGKTLLTIYLAFALAVPIIGYVLVRKEV